MLCVLHVAVSAVNDEFLVENGPNGPSERSCVHGKLPAGGGAVVDHDRQVGAHCAAALTQVPRSPHTRGSGQQEHF